MMITIRIIITVLATMFSLPVAARWATIEDIAIQDLQLNNDFMIYADGRSEFSKDLKYKILNENGRESFAAYPLYYNKSSSNLEILEAKTIVDGQQYKVEADAIEDKPLASNLSGFDQINQTLISFPNVKVGAVINLKTKTTTIKPEMPGLFEIFLVYGGEYIVNSVTRFKSEVPLYISYNDPDKFLDIKHGKDGKYYTLDVQLKRAIHKQIIDEAVSLLGPDRYPWIYVSTMNDWSVFGAKVAAPFIKTMQQPLPAMYKDIADTANKQSDPIAKINTVMSMMNDSIQYMGDWKTSEGRHTPKDLQQVADRRLGDCKDFATGTAAILNSIGIKATVGLLQRGEALYDPSFLELPGQSNFNHAMVKVSLGSKTLWIDPTNFVIIADRILPDIADRQVLVLDAKNTRLEHIPDSQLDDASITSKREITMNSSAVATVKGNTVLQGLSALQMTGAELRTSKGSIEYYVLNHQGDFQNISNKKVRLPDLKSRIATDLDFDFEFDEKSKILNTNAGSAIFFSNSIANTYIFNDDQVSDVYLGAPLVLRDITTIKKITPVNTIPLNCTVSSPWIDAKRTVTYGKDFVTVEQEYIVKTSWIPNAMLKSPAYKKFADDLARDFKGGMAVVFAKK